MKRKIMACILAAALGITGVSFPTAAKTVSVGKNVKNITVNVKNPLDELRAQEAAMQQQEELEEEENMPEQDLDPLVLDNDGSVVPASQASWTKIESGAVEAVDVSEAPGDEEISENSTEDTFSDGSTEILTQIRIFLTMQQRKLAVRIFRQQMAVSAENCRQIFPKERRTAITVPKNFSFSRKTVM